MRVRIEVIMNPLHLAILRIIDTNDGKFSWYQIDRVLSQQGPAGDAWPATGGLMPVLRELERSEYITTTTGPNPAQPLYSITQAGHRQLGDLARRQNGTGNGDVTGAGDRDGAASWGRTERGSGT